MLARGLYSDSTGDTGSVGVAAVISSQPSFWVFHGDTRRTLVSPYFAGRFDTGKGITHVQARVEAIQAFLLME
jgi:hypothetical protein